jgi:hypothetical protein
MRKPIVFWSCVGSGFLLLGAGIAFLCVKLALKGESQPGPNAQTRPAGFDPHSSQHTLKWLHRLAHAAPASNLRALRNSRAKLNEALASLQGQKISWVVVFNSLDEKGISIIPLRTDEGDDATALMFVGAFPPRPDGAWVERLHTGDLVRLHGVLSSVSDPRPITQVGSVHLVVRMENGYVSPVRE